MIIARLATNRKLNIPLWSHKERLILLAGLATNLLFLVIQGVALGFGLALLGREVAGATLALTLSAAAGILFGLSFLFLIWYIRQPGSRLNVPHKAELHLGDVVALTEDLPRPSLRRGQVGTVVESLSNGVFEVEFSDNVGRTYATVPLRADQLMVLHYGPVEVS
jgi:uncharacterized protein (DUF58 family)